MHAELPKTELNLKLEEIGREMVKHCGCLPLSISVIGGILRHENTLNGWEKVRKSIDSYLQHGEGVKGNDKVKQVLYLSYKALPYNLKPCFLYLGCFPEDTEIDAEELYLLWMAGGMISSQDGGRNDTLREVAERYLCELANRCMVQVTRGESSTYNKFESCRLHDLMRDLCLLKGKKDELLEVIDTKMGRRDSFSVSWLAVHSNEAKDDINKYTKLQSLLFFSKSWTPSREWNAIDFRLLKFLKVLKLQGCKFVEGKLPMGIETLIVLKHLSVHRCNVEELPSYVCKLPCVQSLDFRPYQRVRVPNSIYMMGRLRHLLLRRNRREVIGGEKLKFDGLTELETLVGFISNIDDITHLLKLAKLRVLDGTIHDKDSLSVIVDHIYNNQNQFSKTEFTIEKGCNLINSERDGDSSSPLWKTLMCRSLSYLKIECRLNKLPSYEHGLGENLSTLYLWNCYLSENSMEMLEKLPMLRKLVLRRNSFEGMREMVCRSNGFSQLNSLDLWDLHNLVEWRVEEKAMPNLSKLEIRRCKKLEMIPEGLKSITTLKKLIIIGMPKEFNDRLKVMDGQEGEDYHKIKHIPSIEIKIK